MSNRTRPPASAPRSASNAAYIPVLVIAFLLQVLVLAGTFFMGLGWGGSTWLLGLAQAGGALVVIAWLGQRRSWWALLVPFVSATLTVFIFISAES